MRWSGNQQQLGGYNELASAKPVIGSQVSKRLARLSLIKSCLINPSPHLQAHPQQGVILVAYVHRHRTILSTFADVLVQGYDKPKLILGTERHLGYSFQRLGMLRSMSLKHALVPLNAAASLCVRASKLRMTSSIIYSRRKEIRR